ncbi:MAG TPA: hypothetical protein VMS11_14675 [Solirubrobacterales bacterium]|nr:hypothetical protein [Solirubrobacterales bacterium]
MDPKRDSWTDERLDEFRVSVDKRFDAVDKQFDRVDKRFEEVIRRMDAGFARVDGDIKALSGRFDAQQRVLIQIGWTMAAALLTMLASVMGLFVTQL